MPGLINHPTFIPGEDVEHAGPLARLKQLQEILDAVDSMGGGQQEPQLPEEPGPTTGPWNPRHPKFSAFMQRYGPLVQMGGAAIADIGADRQRPDIDTGTVVNQQPSSLGQLEQRFARDAATRKADALHEQGRQDTFRNEKMLNRRAILPTILSALLKDPKEEKAARMPNAQALIEWTESQDWFQKKSPAEQDRIREGILSVKEQDDENLAPQQRAYQSTMGNLAAQEEMGTIHRALSPEDKLANTADEWERDYYAKLMVRPRSAWEGAADPSAIAQEARKAREAYFGPKAAAAPAGGAGAAPGYDRPQFGALGDLQQQFPDIAQVPQAIGGFKLPPFDMQFHNYSPAREQPLPEPTRGLPTGRTESPPPASQVPLTSAAMNAIRPAFLAYDQLKAKYATMPDGTARLARARAAFLEEYHVDPEK